MMEGRKSDSGEATKRQKIKYEGKKISCHISCCSCCSLPANGREASERTAERKRRDSAKLFNDANDFCVHAAHRCACVCESACLCVCVPLSL